MARGMQNFLIQFVFNFMQILGRNGQNNRLAHLLLGLVLPSWKSWIRHWIQCDRNCTERVLLFANLVFRELLFDRTGKCLYFIYFT